MNHFTVNEGNKENRKSLFLHNKRAPPGLSGTDDQGRQRQEVEEHEANESPVEAFVIPSASEGEFSSQTMYLLVVLIFDVCVLITSFVLAYLNVNTNATTRGDAQVSQQSYQIQYFINTNHRNLTIDHPHCTTGLCGAEWVPGQQVAGDGTLVGLWGEL